MNLSPEWADVLSKHGFHARHWIEIGKPDAPDEEIFHWAGEHQYVIFTHDLDFGTLLAYTQSGFPSVIQVRTQNVLPLHLEKIVIHVIRKNETILNEGALISIDETKSRLRILPLRKNE
jgi:predicted nuclease of predicted toxin-antitoxin system